MATQIWIGLQRATGRYLWAFAGFALAGCFGGGKQSTIQPESDSAQIIQDVYALVTWIDLGILIVVGGMLLVAMVRYRESRQTDVDIPKQVHGNIKLEIIWTTVPAILLIFIAIPTWQGIFRAAAPPRAEALQIEAIGHQWWWEFRYPTLGIVTANEMHVPVGKPVVIKTYSVDVIHSFWLPRLAAKIDALPGKSNEVWFTPHNVGKYYGQCAEFCGTSHANMRMLAFVDSEADFDKWAARQEQAPVPTTPDARDGMQLFTQKACVACHTIKGLTGAVGIIGPNLNDLANRHTIASATFDNTPENLSRWIRNSQAMKPGSLMILPFEVNAQEAAKLAAFLRSEPGVSAPATPAPAPAQGAAGASPAVTLMQAKGCGACHIIPGVPGAAGMIGPSLEGLMGRDTIAAGTIPNTPENMRKWLKDPPAMKPGTLMLNLALTDQEIDTLIEFLNTLK